MSYSKRPRSCPAGPHDFKPRHLESLYSNRQLCYFKIYLENKIKRRVTISGYDNGGLCSGTLRHPKTILFRQEALLWQFDKYL